MSILATLATAGATLKEGFRAAAEFFGYKRQRDQILNGPEMVANDKAKKEQELIEKAKNALNNKDPRAAGTLIGD